MACLKIEERRDRPRFSTAKGIYLTIVALESRIFPVQRRRGGGAGVESDAVTESYRLILLKGVIHRGRLRREDAGPKRIGGEQPIATRVPVRRISWISRVVKD